MNQLTISRRFDFSASHRYYRDDWSVEKNHSVFGLCALPNGHGHNYTLDVSVAGIPDPSTGMVINLVELKSIVDRILEEFDHKHLNLDTPYYHERIPTTENLVIVLWDLINSHLPDSRLSHLRLYETDDLFVDYYGDQEC